MNFNLLSKLKGATNKYSGQKDFLEAVCASAALVAASDGSISDEEIGTTIKIVAANPSLSSAFSTREIEGTAEAMLKRAQAGRTGRMGLYKELEDISADGEKCETVYLTALDVAESDGSIGDEEKATLAKIAAALKVDPKKFEV